MTIGLRADHTPSRKSRLKLLAYGTSDSLGINLQSPPHRTQRQRDLVSIKLLTKYRDLGRIYHDVEPR